MARVPQYQRQIGDSPAARTPFRVGTTAESFGASTGQALAQLGQGALRVSDALQARALVEADRDAQGALLDFREREREILRDPTEGYLSQSGLNADDPGFRSASARLDAAAAEVRAGLDPEAQRRFDDAVAQRNASNLDTMANHRSTQQRQGTLATYNAAATASQLDALEAQTEEQFARALGEAADNEATAAYLSSGSREVADLAVEKLVSDTVRGRILQVMDRDPGGALEYLEQHRDKLSASHIRELEGLAEPLVRQQRARADLSGFQVTGGQRPDTPGALPSNIGLDLSGRGRSEPPRDRVLQGLSNVAATALGPDYRFVVTSGREPEGAKPVGSALNHPHGIAADGYFENTKTGEKLSISDPRVGRIVDAAGKAGFFGFGAGKGYMGDYTFHFDMRNRGANGQGGRAAWGARGDKLESRFVAAGRAYENGEGLPSGLAASDSERATIAGLGELGGAIVEQARQNPIMLAKGWFKANGIADQYDQLTQTHSWLDGSTSMHELVSRIGVHTGTRPEDAAGPQFDFKGAYEYAMTIADPEYQAEFIRQVEIMEGLQQAADTAARRSAGERIWENYLENDDDRISLQDQLLLGPSGVNQLQGQMETHRNRTFETPETQHDELKRMLLPTASDAERTQFTETGWIEEQTRGWDPADRELLIAARDQLRAEMAGQDMDTEARVQNARSVAYVEAAEYRPNIERMLGVSYGTDLNEQEMASALSSMERQLAKDMATYIRTQKGRPMPRAQVEAWIAAQMLPVAAVTPGRGDRQGSSWPGSVERLRDLESLPDGARAAQIVVEADDIPATDRAEIVEAFKALYYDADPSQEQIADFYEERLLRRAGLPRPNGGETMLDMPMAVRYYLRQTEGLDEATAAAAWEEYSAGVLDGTIDPVTQPFMSQSGGATR